MDKKKLTTYSVANSETSAKEVGLQVERHSFKKIFFHIDKLHEYLNSGDSYPLHMVIGFTDYCNHECLWCYTAYSTHNDLVVLEDGTSQHVNKFRDEQSIKPDVLLKFLREAKSRGLKAVKIVGSGEPLLHPESTKMMEEICKMGLNFGVLGNGQKMLDSHFKVLTKYATFFRFSLDAADAKTYKKLHGIRADFDETISNMKRLVAERSLMGKSLPTIGAQFVVSQLNAGSMIPFVEMMLDIGLDYVSFKPMYDNPINIDRAMNTMSVSDAMQQLKSVKRYETARFKVYCKGGEQFRNVWGASQRFNGADYYQKCMSHQFVPSLHANGNIYLCVNLSGRKEFILGNIYDNTLKEIWQSENRQEAIGMIDLLHKCPARCYLDPMNKIMWDITHPDPEIHPDFL